jgi:membrane dipeptidase
MKKACAITLTSVLVLSAFSIPAAAQSAPAKTGQTETPQLSRQEAALWRRAMAIHRSSIVVDTHNDILSMMTDDNYDLGTSSAGKYHTDLARMKQGGVTAEFFSVYVSARYATQGGSARRALDMIDYVYRAVERHPKD